MYGGHPLDRFNSPSASAGVLDRVCCVGVFGELVFRAPSKRGWRGWRGWNDLAVFWWRAVDILSGRGACPIDDWIGRRCRDRGTSIIAYLSSLGTERDRRLAFLGLWRMVHRGKEKCWGRGPEFNFGFERRGRISQVLDWTRRIEPSSNMVMIETMGRPCGKELGSGVHALWRRNDRRSRFGVLEHVMYVRLDGGEALHNAGRTVRRGEWRWRHWRQVYHIEQGKEGVYHWQGNLLSAYRHEGLRAKGTQGGILDW